MFSIIDIETTGGNAKNDKITEIAVYVHDGEKIIDEYQSLINPERPIPYFISQLTGIDDNMVANAPKFYEVAKKIVEITQDTVFIAHNVGFDYNFIREEFKTLGFEFKMKKLCTVQLSRKLLPGMDSYSLGKLCKQLDIQIEGRHRAAGDALATVKLFDILLSKDNNRFIKISADKKEIAIPAHISNDLIKPLPEETGVYYFYDNEDNLIYIGKSKNVRSRIVSHFNNTKTQKAQKMQQQIKRIDYELTGSELIALLKESEEIKVELPIYNRAQRKSLFNYGIFLNLELDGYIHCRAQKIMKNQQPTIVFSSLQEAKSQLRNIVDENELCLKLSGLYQTEGACFYHQIERCHGACVGKEGISDYNARVNQAFEKYTYKKESLIIVDKGRSDNEKSVVLVDKGQYLGYGYMDEDEQIGDPQEVYNLITMKKDTKDVHQIIRNFLKNNRVEKVIHF
jgi:DNA polymerase-3 subunit epsilon